ncbi:MAG: RagB/SusD family nutrient uptake outer membrane protein [Mangrovibacterium sp.]
MKTYIKYILCLSVGLGIFACNDFLDIQPEDKFLEEQLFSTQEGISLALNGIYAQMVAKNAYGGELTMNTIEVMAQSYNVGDSRHSAHSYGKYAYKDGGVQSKFNSIWVNMYTNILNINNLLQGLELYPQVLAAREDSLVRGEAHALRAMLHFDLLRLFGPVYYTNAQDDAIPYYTEPKAEMAEMLSAEQVIVKVLDDLNLADSLLSKDPIRTSGPMKSAGIDFNDTFFRYRNFRLNYYAVKALQARVNLYAGNKEAALEAAKVVIDEATVWFPWILDETITSGGANIDRAFSTEVIFALENNDLYNRQKDYFAANLSQFSILAPTTQRLEQVFENNISDYRFEYSWFISTEAAKDYRTFFKFADVEDKSLNFRFMQPLIRMSEMYYIAAETEPDPTVAIDYLNVVRYERGLEALESTANIEGEIHKEYRKEFYGEGQMFFYYKRKNLSSIPNGSNMSSIDMGAAQYVVPLPLSETDYR